MRTVKWILVVTVLALALVLVSQSGAVAGGWTVTTLDYMPTDIVTDSPVTVAMMIRQHGKTPWVYDRVYVKATHPEGAEVAEKAKMDVEGHYTADLTFPIAGTWQWAVSSGLLPEWQPMPELVVLTPAEAEGLAAEATATNAAPPTEASTIQTMAPQLALMGLGVLGMVGCAAGLVAWWKRRG